jgi:hypothetical protein
LFDEFNRSQFRGGDMKFEQFVSSFKNPEASARCAEYPIEKEVVIAGTMLATTPDSCCVSVNGVPYEIASNDVIDIQVIPPVGSQQEKKADVAPQPAASKQQGPPPVTVLVKVNGGAILTCRTPVPARLLAAIGTWMQVVLPAAKAA